MNKEFGVIGNHAKLNKKTAMASMNYLKIIKILNAPRIRCCIYHMFLSLFGMIMLVISDDTFSISLRITLR